MEPGKGFLLAVGVTVALVPEGLLPTVTLSLARAAQRMAGRKALVRRLESVGTLGSTTFICTDKTGTLTRNQMTAVDVWTPTGTARAEGAGYGPDGQVLAEPSTLRAVQELSATALLCSAGRVAEKHGRWQAIGEPMEAALHTLALRADTGPRRRARPAKVPLDNRRRRTSVVTASGLYLKGAPDSVLPRCRPVPGADTAFAAMASIGLRVLAVARRTEHPLPADQNDAERDPHRRPIAERDQRTKTRGP